MWFENYDLLDKFITLHKRRPLARDDNIIDKLKIEQNNVIANSKEFKTLVENEKYLGKWLSHQITRYNKLNENNNIIIQKDNNLTISDEYFLIYWNNLINKFKNLFQSNESIWNDKCLKLINFIEINNIKPSKNSIDNNEKSIANWINANRQNYIKNSDIMKNKSIRYKWVELIKKYPILN